MSIIKRVSEMNLFISERAQITQGGSIYKN